jgi:hypothetical protein
MNAVMAHHEVVVTNPTEQEAAGATIGRQTDVWIPLLSATFATGSRMAVEMARCGNHKPISTPAWKSRKERGIPIFPQAISRF